MSIPIGSFLRSVMLAPPQSLIEKGSMKPLICKINDIMKPFFRKAIVYSTVTLLARFRGLSTSMWIFTINNKRSVLLVFLNHTLVFFGTLIIVDTHKQNVTRIIQDWLRILLIFYLLQSGCRILIPLQFNNHCRIRCAIFWLRYEYKNQQILDLLAIPESA